MKNARRRNKPRLAQVLEPVPPLVPGLPPILLRLLLPVLLQHLARQQGGGNAPPDSASDPPAAGGGPLVITPGSLRGGPSASYCSAVLMNPDF